MTSLEGKSKLILLNTLRQLITYNKTMAKITLNQQEFTNYYNKLSTAQFAKLLGVNRTSIYNKAKKYGIIRNKAITPKLVITDNTSKTLPDGTILVSKKVFIGLYRTLTTQKLASIYNVTRMTIHRKAKQLGISK